MPDTKGIVFRVPDVCIIGNAVTLKEELEALSGKKGAVEIDIGGIEKIDLTGIQTLYSFLYGSKTSGMDLKITGELNEQVLEVLTLAGVPHLFSGYKE
jgi:ABC-type transporter Mla MlaB component